MSMQFAYQGNDVSDEYVESRYRFINTEYDLPNVKSHITYSLTDDQWEHKSKFYKYYDQRIDSMKYFGILIDKKWDQYLVNDYQGFGFQCDQFGISAHDDFYDSEWEGVGVNGQNENDIRKGILFDIYHFQLTNN
jgi:hypothetical protein